MKKTVAIVGLGLMGGSLAMALKGFEDYEVLGVVRRQATMDYALAHGVGDSVTRDTRAACVKRMLPSCASIPRISFGFWRSTGMTSSRAASLPMCVASRARSWMRQRYCLMA